MLIYKYKKFKLLWGLLGSRALLLVFANWLLSKKLNIAQNTLFCYPQRIFNKKIQIKLKILKSYIFYNCYWLMLV